ncbi:L,D-transpeptidase family protein [Candidatus Uhrbacteria bacterium]|nr:L,D-transpeptidase family protein [Candidatus Uhrbacteria bacterium]
MRYFFITVLLGICAVALPAEADEIRAPEVRILSTDGDVRTKFAAFPEDYIGGISVAAGDLGRDGIPEIVVGGGFGVEPRVKIFRQNGSLITSFLAYERAFSRGTNVAVGDVDGDGVNEIITGPAYGGGPHVRIFDGRGTPKYSGFFAYQERFKGGAFVATGDLDGDGKAEIITGAGPSGGPHVRVWNERGELQHEFFAFVATDASGVTVGTGDLDADGRAEILVGRASSDPPQIKIFTPEGRELGLLTAFEATFTGGVTPIGADINNDGRDEIIVAPNGGSAPIKIFRNNGVGLASFMPFEDDFTGAVRIAAAPISAAGESAVVVAPGRPFRDGNVVYPKSIVVDLSEQRLYAYEHGLVAQSFLVSSGVKKYPTPVGDYEIQKKVPMMDYVWTYGPNHPDNYAIPDVPWNLRFKPNYFIHYAYWHNDFGRPRSHGCVNLPLEPAKWIYEWAELGTPVVIRE